MSTEGQTTESRKDSGAQHDRLRSLGKYRIKKKLGAGGMGTVFLAVDEELNRTVALKVLPRERAENPTLVKRFKSEAQAAAQLENKNIVRVYEAGEADGFLYIALEYVEGIDVHDLVVKRGVLPVKRSIDIVKQMAKALDHAASKQIVHRDIKPANLMIKRDGTVKLADMGLARSIDETTETNITRAGMTVGTVDYMSPEQARNSQSADVRSDIYSLGCTWYHMLTGRPPFPEGGLSEKLQAHAVGKRPDPRDENEAVPEAVVAVLHRMMACKPADRYQTPQELLDDLELASKSLNVFNASVMEALDEEPSPTSRRKSRDRSAAGPSELPPAEGFQPVDVTPGRRIDVDIIRFAIPAVLVVFVLGVLVWAMRQGGDALSGGADGVRVNPYDEIEEHGVNGNANDPAGAVLLDGRTDEPSPESQLARLTPSTRRLTEPPSVMEVPFPGAEDTETTLDGVRLIPNWVDKFRAARKEQQQTLVVTRRVAREGQYRHLNEAIDALPGEGGIIEVDSDGPFVLEPTEIVSRGTVRLIAAEGRHPVILLSSPDKYGFTREWLTVRAPQLEIDNLHFVLVDPSAEETTLLRMAEGDVSLRNCSVTVRGEGAVTAIVVGGQSKTMDRNRPLRGSTGGRCLLENVVCRGARLSAVRLLGERSELVAGNCLILSGDSPAIVVTDTGMRRAVRSGVAADRGLRLLATTLISSRSAVQFVHSGSARAPTPCEVVVRKSLLATNGVAEDPLAVAMVNYTGLAEGASNLGSSRATAVEWSTEESLYLGWPILVKLSTTDGTELNDIATADEWRKFWNKPIASSTVIATITPPENWEHPGSIAPGDVSPAKLTALIGLDRELEAGCRPDDLSSLPLGMIDHVTVASRAPDVPDDIGAGMQADASPIQFDMMRRRSLSRFLESDLCRDGTHIIATGSGLRKMDPVEIADKSVRLEFKTTGSKPLMIQITSHRDDSEPPQAAITVRNGTLDLVGGRFKLPATSSQHLPSWLLRLAGSSLSLRGCTLEGPSTPSAGHSGLIQIAADEDAGAGVPCSVLIEDSFLISPGRLLSGPIRWDSLILRNSVFVSQSDLLHLQLDESGLLRQPSIVISHCTFAGGKAIFRFEGEVPSSDDLPPLDLIVMESVLAAGISGDDTTVVARESETQTQHHVRWWGNANGFAPALWRFVVTGDRPGPSASFDHEWTYAWGAGHEAHPLTGATDVIFDSSFPGWAALEPSSFPLNASSPAATWASDGLPIGADVGQVGAGIDKDAPSGKSSPRNAAPGAGNPKNRSRNRNLF